MDTRKLRRTMLLCAVLLLGSEILIGMLAHGWVRNSLGDILVVILLWTLCRAVSPAKPRYGMLLPAAILLFAFGVEFLQLWGFCDRLHITNRLLRIMIGTGFSVSDLICYTAGILPCMAAELLLRKRSASIIP